MIEFCITHDIGFHFPAHEDDETCVVSDGKNTWSPAYLQKMKSCRQFIMMDVEPKWIPGTGDIDGFIHDEVVRQFHDPRVESDGGCRIRWMRAAWDFALHQSGQGGLLLGVEMSEGISLARHLPDMDDILRLGKTIEPGVNSTTGFRMMNVYIGGDMGAPPGLLPALVAALVAQVGRVHPEQGNPGPHADDYRRLWSGYRTYDPIVNDGIVEDYAKTVRQVETADDWYLAYEAIHPFGDGNGRSGKVLHNWLLQTLDEPVLVRDYFGMGNP